MCLFVFVLLYETSVYSILVTMASMDEELTCSVCRDTFSQSQPLPCGHSFCPACVREAWSSQGEGKGRFTCPQCQEEHGEVLCDCCPPEAEKGQPPLAVKTCLRCEVSLCAEHLRPHLERPVFSTHLLVDPLGDLSQRRCPAHTELFRYYCADERVYVCGDCLLEGGHAQHKVKALRHVEDDLKVCWMDNQLMYVFMLTCGCCNTCWVIFAGHPSDTAYKSRGKTERWRANPQRA